jgi:MFS transporter, DHA1 family, multidrug resistance protein
MTNKQHFILILLLGSLATISPFSIDMYLPGFPTIAEDLNTTIAAVQLSLTSYFIGIAAGQILYGPLLDRYGRKIPLYTGLIIYVIASFACAFTKSVESLIVMRFLQAVGGCAGMVAAQALVRDIFPVDKTAQAFSWMTLVVAVSPMIAPTLGGYATVAFGWHSIFIILAVITIIILVLSYTLLPSGKKPDPSLSLRPKPVINNFITVLKQPQFLIYTFVGSFAAAAPFAYIAGSADVFMNLYHVSEQAYGWIFAIIAGVMIGSSQLNHIFLKYSTNERIIKISLLMQCSVGVVLFAGTVLGWFDMITLIVLISLLVAGHGLVNPNSTALSLAPFSKLTGSAASLSGSMRMALGGVASAIVSALHNGTAIPMISVMVGCVLIAAILLLIGRLMLRSQTKKQGIDEKAISI